MQFDNLSLMDLSQRGVQSHAGNSNLSRRRSRRNMNLRADMIDPTATRKPNRSTYGGGRRMQHISLSTAGLPIRGHNEKRPWQQTSAFKKQKRSTDKLPAISKSLPNLPDVSSTSPSKHTKFDTGISLLNSKFTLSPLSDQLAPSFGSRMKPLGSGKTQMKIPVSTPLSAFSQRHDLTLSNNSRKASLERNNVETAAQASAPISHEDRQQQLEWVQVLVFALAQISILNHIQIAQGQGRRGYKVSAKVEGAVKIQNHYRKRKQRNFFFKHFFKCVKYNVIMAKHSWRLALAVRCWRRHGHGSTIQAFIRAINSGGWFPIMRTKVHIVDMQAKVRMMQKMAKGWMACREARVMVLRSAFTLKWDAKVESLQNKYIEEMELQSERDEIKLAIVKNDPEQQHEACDVICRQTDKELQKLLSKFSKPRGGRSRRSSNASSRRSSASGLRLGELTCPHQMRDRGVKYLLCMERKGHMAVVSKVLKERRLQKLVEAAGMRKYDLSDARNLMKLANQGKEQQQEQAAKQAGKQNTVGESSMVFCLYSIPRVQEALDRQVDQCLRAARGQLSPTHFSNRMMFTVS